MRRLKKSATIAAQACIAVCVMLAPHARAQSWKPDKPVEIVVTCQPGCGPDIAARIIQKIWQDHRLVQVPSAVINKAGGGGAVAYSYIQQKPGDGHVMVRCRHLRMAHDDGAARLEPGTACVLA